MLNFFKKTYLVISLIIGAGILIRLFLAKILPVINDEAMYLADALLVSQGFIPYQDFITRFPFLIYALSPLIKIFGPHLWLGRGLSIIAAALTSLLLYFIGQELFNRKAGLIACLLYSLVPISLVTTSYVLTEPLQVLLITAGFYFLIKGIKNKSFGYFALNGCLMGLAILTRLSGLCFLPFQYLLIYLMIEGRILDKIRFIFWSLLNSLFIWALVCFYFISQGVSWLSLYRHMGPGLNLIARKITLTSLVGPSQVWPEMGPTISHSLFFIFILLVFLVVFLKMKNWPKLVYLSLAYFLLGLIIFYPLIYSGHIHLFIIFSCLIFIFLLPRLSQLIDLKKDRNFAFLLLLFWFLSPSLGYFLLKKWSLVYSVEYLPMACLVGGILFCLFLNSFKSSPSLFSRFVILVFSGLLVINLIFSLLIFSQGVPNGTWSVASVKEAANYLKSEAKTKDEVFTAAVIIPYLSGHSILLNITHPVIYKFSARFREFYPVPPPKVEQIQAYLEKNQVKYVINDLFTYRCYFRQFPELAEYVQSHYHLVKVIPNSISQDIEIYQRNAELGNSQNFIPFDKLRE